MILYKLEKVDIAMKGLLKGILMTAQKGKRSAVEKASIFLANTNNHIQSVGRNMDTKDDSSDVSERNKDVIRRWQKGIPYYKVAKILSSCEPVKPVQWCFYPVYGILLKQPKKTKTEINQLNQALSKIFIYLFWLLWVSAVACGIFTVALEILVSTCMQDLVPQPGIEPGPFGTGSVESYPLSHQGNL